MTRQHTPSLVRAEILARVAAAFNAVHTHDGETLHMAVREWRLALGADRAAIALADAAEGSADPSHLVIAASDGLSAAHERGLVIDRAAGSPLWAAMAAGSPLYTETPHAVDTPREPVMQAELILPLWANQTILGAVLAGWREPAGRPDDNVMAFAQSLADICAAALARYRADEARERSLRLAGALNAAMTHALDTNDENAALAAVGLAIEEIGLHLHIWLLDEAKERGVLRYTSQLLQVGVAVEGGSDQPIATMSLSASALGLDNVLPERGAAYVPDTMVILRRYYPTLPPARIERIAQFIDSPHAAEAPLRASGDILGLCVIFGNLQPGDLPLVQAWADAIAGLLMHHRLLAAMRETARRQSVLAEVTGALPGGADPHMVLERAVDAAAELLKAHTVAAFLRRDDGQGFDALASRGLALSEMGVPTLSMERSIAGRAVRENRLQAVEDAAIERAAGIVSPNLAGNVAVGSLLVAPIAEAGEEPAGVLEVFAAQPRSWPQEDRTLLQALAAACAVALRTARETERAHRDATRAGEDARRLAALNRIADTIIGAPSFGVMCDRALEAIVELLQAPIGCVYAHDDEAPPDRALRSIAWRGLSHQAAMTLNTLAIGDGVVGEAARRREIVAHDTLDDAPPAARATASLAQPDVMQAGASAPMLVRGHLLGVLAVASIEPRTWSETDLALLQTVANQLAAALEAEQLRRAAVAAAAAREAERLKDELLSTVNHELRTPLGAIKGFASGLRHYGERLDAAERADSLRLIDEAADRLSELIDNLLDRQRLESGRLAINLGTVDLREIAALVIREMTPQAPSHSFELVTGSEVAPISGDARRLRQVVQNLVENAIKYSPKGGRIVVRLTADPNMAYLRVEDDGLGIPPAQLTLIFERFHRVDSSTTRAIGGTGLGLSIVKGIVVAHGGRIHAESAGEGCGSAFVVALPRQREGDGAAE